MNTITGTYFDGRHPVGSPATLMWFDEQARIVGEHALTKHPVRELVVSPRVGTADRFVSLPNGAQLQCRDTPLLDALPQESAAEGIAAWLEQRWAVALIGVATTLALLAFGYLYGLPRAAEYAAARIPMAAERELGDTSLRWLDSRGMLAASKLSCDSQDELRTRFNQMIRGLSYERDYRLEFRNAPALGANAITLPGGIVVITDAMVDLTDTADEALAVLAHEIGHVELRHTLRHALQDAGIAGAITALTGDAASLSTAVAGLPVVLAQANYSREFETAADDYAIDLLKRHRISPARFADVMEKLDRSHNGQPKGIGFLASHPPTPERIDRARAAAGVDSMEERYSAEEAWPGRSEGSRHCASVAGR